MSLTVADLRDRYLALVASDEVHFYRLLNEAEARLQETAKWNWCKTEAVLDVEDGHVYLDPAVYASLLGVILDNGARVVRPREIEFTPGGYGRAIAGDPGAGHIVDCGIVTSYLEDDTRVSRRKYKVADAVSGSTADCLLQWAHTALVHYGDYTLCPSARALKLAMLAVGYEEVDDADRAKTYWADAFAALNEQESTQRGGVRGSATIQPFGDGISPVGSLM
jgi:hypothetical protein